MTSRNGATISWSSYNYPTLLAAGSESTGFYYGPDRQYYKQVYTGPSGTETTNYVGGLLEKVVVGSTTDWRHYISAEGQTVAIVSRKSTGSNSVSYPLEDHEGSSSVLTNSSGGSIVKESFNAFGLPRNGSTWSGAVPSGDKTLINGLTRRGYTFHSMLGDMGLIHMNGRVQDAVTGRFLSPDPTIPSPGFTQSYNRYSYVNNNPLSFIDPSGFEWKQYCGSVGGVEGTDDPGLSQRCAWDWIQTPDDFLRLYGCAVRPESCADLFGTDHSNQNVYSPTGPLESTYYPLDTEHQVEKWLDQKGKEEKKIRLQQDPKDVCTSASQAPAGEGSTSFVEGSPFGIEATFASGVDVNFQMLSKTGDSYSANARALENGARRAANVGRGLSIIDIFSASDNRERAYKAIDFVFTEALSKSPLGPVGTALGVAWSANGGFEQAARAKGLEASVQGVMAVGMYCAYKGEEE